METAQLKLRLRAAVSAVALVPVSTRHDATVVAPFQLA